ncbi:MAG: hypothetical protein H0V43_03310 [Gemmatimonadales bacterium]|nr:hypothetical protein [Gemmatimonadales bacterium]
MKRSRSNICSSTSQNQRVLAQPQAFRTENVVARSAEDLQKWLFKNWDNEESSMNKLSNLLQEQFYAKEGDKGSPLKMVKKEYRASDRKIYWWELEIVLLAGGSDNHQSKTFSMFIRDVTNVYEELVRTNINPLFLYFPNNINCFCRTN